MKPGKTEVLAPTAIYLAEISQFSLLSAGEEKSLARRIIEEQRSQIAQKSHGDVTGATAVPTDTALNELVKSNLRLVVNIARGYANRGLSLPDLIQEGNIGLMEAARRFSDQYGKFSTYASWWIKQAIRRALHDQGGEVRLPVHAYEIVNEWRAARRQTGSNSSREQIAEQVFENRVQRRTDELKSVKANIARGQREGESEESYQRRNSKLLKREAQIESALSPERIGKLAVTKSQIKTIELAEAIMAANAGKHSGDASDDRDPMAQLSDKDVSPAEGPLEDEQIDIIRNFLGRIDARDAQILMRRFPLNGEKPSTLKQVGDDVGLVRERVRQIQECGLYQLRALLSGPQHIELREHVEELMKYYDDDAQFVIGSQLGLPGYHKLSDAEMAAELNLSHERFEIYRIQVFAQLYERQETGKNKYVSGSISDNSPFHLAS